ncbi:MAG: hypothetical protein KatS3mg102_1442 [Planctomycetota bacterium]|nr:MAG: hypothetical protein KatS3mg102_1442 [Planctomycetota bacterium]
MALTAPRLGTLLSALLLPPGAVLRRLVRQLPRPVLARWDALGRTRRVPGWGGADAHDNLRLPGPRGGLPLLSYHDSFRAVLNVLLVRERSAEGVREALAAGRGWVAFELSGRSEGFRFALFEAGPGGAWLADMGAELRWRPGLELRAAAPGGAQLVLLRDGRPLARARGRLVARPPGPGVYRIEAYLGAEPFILSNAIYLRSGAAAEPP